MKLKVESNPGEHSQTNSPVMGYLNISYWRNKIINKREMLTEAQIYIICIDEQS